MILRDKFWLWGHPEGRYNNNADGFGFGGVSRMTPMEGCLYLGVRNVFMVPVGVKVDRRQYNKSFKTLNNVGWECFDAIENPHKINELINEAKDFQNISIEGKFTFGKEKVKNNFRIENPDRMPDVHMHHNEFRNFPHIRMSGAGEMLAEENIFADCEAALLCLDLAPFWYESGRVKHLVYRNNILDNCNGKGKEEFIRVGIDGIDDEKAPQIHEKIEIVGNKFINIKKYAVRAAGLKELVFKGNVFDGEYDDVIKTYKQNQP